MTVVYTHLEIHGGLPPQPGHVIQYCEECQRLLVVTPQSATPCSLGRMAGFLCVHALTSVSTSIEVIELPPSLSVGGHLSSPHHSPPSVVECLSALSSVIKVFLPLLFFIASG